MYNSLQKNKLTEATDPVKIYEYLSSGKPVVSTDLGELERLREIIYIAKNNEDFLNMLEIALKENDPIVKQKRISFAKENTWDKRVSELNDIIISKLFPKISIIIPTYNGINLLKPCIESIIQKTAYPNYEIIVIDNNSDDGTP